MKNRTTKIALILLALVLATSFVVGTTLAKYTTKISGTDTTRVAKWGVVLTTDSDLFDEDYKVSAINAEISVDARDNANVVAPGTTKTATIFTIAGVPEVDVDVLITLNADNALKMVKLAAGEYDDLTDFTAPTAKYTVADDYYPVEWTLTFDPSSTDAADPSAVATGNLQAIETYLDSISKKYEILEDSSEFDAICGTYVLSWEWTFENTVDLQPEDDGYAAAVAAAALKDKMDTTLGQLIAADPDPATDLVETFKLLITVTQVD